MKSEIKLFQDDIKPALLISEDTFNRQKEYLTNFKYKYTDTNSVLLYKKEEDIANKSLGEILGYYPKSVKLFEVSKNERQNQDIIVSEFINYGGIYFNCFDQYKEALAWCDEQYKEKMLKKYGSFTVTYKVVKFTRNKVGGFSRTVLHAESMIITK